MNTNTNMNVKTPLAITVVELPIAMHIPVSVLAQMPEKLRLLAAAIKACSKSIDGDDDEFDKAHCSVSRDYYNANSAAKRIIDAITELSALKSEEITDILAAANSAKQLTGAIHKICGNIHNDDCFMTTFNDTATVNATVAALNHCGDEIRTAIRKFGY
ncbi:MAG: hypothetical protein Q8T09_02750 [Candidatus Melainabacteria bacterium]|nr:hypothetical protein [Candidatus Melainabacteria bacterium]